MNFTTNEYLNSLKLLNTIKSKNCLNFLYTVLSKSNGNVNFQTIFFFIQETKRSKLVESENNFKLWIRHILI